MLIPPFGGGFFRGAAHPGAMTIPPPPPPPSPSLAAPHSPPPLAAAALSVPLPPLAAHSPGRRAYAPAAREALGRTRSFSARRTPLLGTSIAAPTRTSADRRCRGRPFAGCGRGMRLGAKAGDDEDGEGGGDGEGDDGGRGRSGKRGAKIDGKNANFTELADADLFDDLDLDYDDDVRGNLLEENLDEIMRQMDDGDFLVLADEDEEEEEEEQGTEGSRGGGFVVASAELDLDDVLGELVVDVDDDLDDEALLELLGVDDDVDPDDLLELERILRLRRRVEDALELERILAEQRRADPSSSDASDGGGGEDEDDGDASARRKRTTPDELERALLQGVVPADAGVGSGSLPGDFGFDPLGLSTRDYFKRTQKFLLGLLPESEDEREEEEGRTEEDMGYDGSALPKGWRIADQEVRPPALILRDYREAEIRHGRLAMLAAVLWPLQEIFDRLLIPGSFGHTTVVYGGPTLPYLPLLMTAIMLLLGYLDIYAASVKDADAGEAFLPGECFWDPLRMLDGAPDAMKRNMQERELNNGRMAMVAVAFYIIEEAASHRPLIALPFNEFLFEPAYQIPAVQAWLDRQFQSPSPAFTFPEVGTVDFVETLREVMEEGEQQGAASASASAVAASAAGDVATAGVDGGILGGGGGGQTNIVDTGDLLP